MRKPVLYALAGLALAALDLAGLWVFGLKIESEARDLTIPIMGTYGLTFGLLGFVIGRLAEANATIRGQVAALREQQRALVQAENLASVGRMAASVAHEVRNPLAVIRSSASLIGEQVEDPELTEVTGFIVAEVDRLDAYVGRILDLSRTVTPQLERIRLDEVAQRAMRLVEAPVDDDVPPSLIARADPNLVTGTLLGLLVNADQAGAGRIVIRGGHDGERVWLDVVDDGPGIPEADRAQLFEPFYTTRASGTGLGLALGRRMARAQGGDLTLFQAAPTTFRLALQAGPP